MLGISANSLARYERGEREPSASVIAAYSSAYKASVYWILTGKGEIFVEPPHIQGDKSLRTIDPSIFREVGRLVVRVHKDAGVTLPPDALFDQQSTAYNALIQRADNAGDTEEMLSLLPWLETRLRKSLKDATLDPGAGKRPA